MGLGLGLVKEASRNLLPVAALVRDAVGDAGDLLPSLVRAFIVVVEGL